MKKRQVQMMLASMILASITGVGANTKVLASGSEGYKTPVRYTGAQEGKEEYTIEVPALLVPGGEAGNVKLDGLWKSTVTINITAPETVDMKNDIDDEVKTINVNFDDIHQSGDNNQATSVTKPISVDALEGALLGNWEGFIVYNVTATDSNGDELHVHEWESDYTIDKEASCTEDGQKSIHCKSCNEVKDIEVIQGGHQMDETGNCTECNDPAAHQHVWDTDYTIDAEPTCSEDGSKSIHCAGCDETKDVTPIVSTGHNYQNNICTECGQEMVAGLYDVNGNLLATYEESGIDVEIDFNTSSGSANYYGGDKSARKIIANKYPTAKKLVLPDDIGVIGAYAFYYESNLTEIVIPDSVVSIGSKAFSGSAITRVRVPSNIEIWGDDTFSDCTSLKEVIVPEGVTTIGKNAFSMEYSRYSTIKELKLPESLVSIGEGAFYGADIESLYIPNNVEVIGSKAFSNCEYLTDITVGDNNQNYCAVSDVLFSKDKTVLCIYPIGKTKTSYSVPTFVTKIGDYAFYNGKNLTSITVSKGLTHIGKYAFYNTSLVTFTVPASVKRIGASAFWRCEDTLTGITFVDTSYTWYEDGNSVTDYDFVFLNDAAYNVKQLTRDYVLFPSMYDVYRK